MSVTLSSLSGSSNSAISLTCVSPYTLYQSSVSLQPAIYTISCTSSTTAKVEFYSGFFPPHLSEFDEVCMNVGYIMREDQKVKNDKLKKSYIVSAGLTTSVLWNSNEIYNYQKFTSSQNFNRLDLMLNLSVQKWFTRWGFELRNSNSIIPVRNYATAGNQINFGNPIANAFNRGLYNNIMVLSVLYKITP